MLRKKYTMLGLVVFTMIILVLSGCGGGGGGSNGGGGGDDDPIPFAFNAASLVGTTWKCATSDDRPEITVEISDIIESETITGYACYTGSVKCATTGTIAVDTADLYNIIWLLGVKEGKTELISFHVYATSHNDDVIQIDGVIGFSDMNTVTVDYLMIDYEDEMANPDYEYDDEYSSETVIFTRI